MWLLNNELCLRLPRPPAMIYDALGGIYASGCGWKGPHHTLPNIILLLYVNCQINCILFIKWCQSPKIDNTTTSPGQENCSIVSQLALYQRAQLNSPRWRRYNVGITPPSIDVQKTVATWHFMGCIFIHGPNSPTLQLNPWFYPSSAMYWYVGALGAWILRLLRW